MQEGGGLGTRLIRVGPGSPGWDPRSRGCDPAHKGGNSKISNIGVKIGFLDPFQKP